MRSLPVLLALLGACNLHTADPASLSESTLPQALVSSELELGVGSQIATNAVRRQLLPGSAMINNTALVVWQDERHTTEGDLFGAFVDALGHTILSTQPIVVAPGHQGSPAVATSGTEYLVVYEQGAAPNTDIFGVYVQPNGQVGTPFAIASTGAYEQQPTVAFGGGKYMVAWSINGGAGNIGPIWSVRFADAAMPGAPELTGDGPFSDQQPSVGYDGVSFLLAWSETLATTSPNVACIATLRIAPGAGALTSSPGTCLSRVPPKNPDAGNAVQIQQAPSVATVPSGSGETIVAWQDLRNGGLFGTKVFFARVQNGTAVASESDGGLLVALGSHLQFTPRAVQSKASFFTVNWIDSDLNSSGALWWDVATGGQAFTAVNPGSPAADAGNLSATWSVASNPTTQILNFAWSAYSGTDFYDTDLFGSSGSSGGDIKNRVDFSSSQNAQESPAVAAGPLGQLTAWADYQGYDAGTSQAFDIAYAFLAADGGAVTQVLAHAGDQVTPSAAAGGDAGFFIAWQEGEIHGAAISSRGTVVDSGIPLMVPLSGMTSPAVVFDGTQYVVFAGDGFIGGGGTMQAVRVRTNGAPIDAMPRALYTTVDGGNPYLPSAASNGVGTSLVVTTIQGTSQNAPNAAVVGLLFLPDAGTKAPVVLPATRPGRSTVDFDGKNFFVVWEDGRNVVSTGVDLYGIHVTPSGTLVEGSAVPLTVGSGDSVHPALGFDGRLHVLAWQQIPADGGSYDVQGAVLTADAGVLGPFAVATSEFELEPAAAGFNAQTLVAYTRWKSAPPYGANRIFGSVVSWGNGEVCSSDADCVSGFCVSNGSQHICCDKACNGVCETCFQTAGTCTPRPSTTLCRGADGGCDLAESCDGVNGACPADAPQAMGTVCRGADGGCDVTEACDGTGFACPPDAVKPVNAVCQSSVLLCALPATCDGTAHECPATGVQGPTSMCRAASDAGCDLPEFCDGVSQMCPVDTFADSTVRCRSTGKACDLDEFCTGNSVGCPADLFRPTTYVCRQPGPVCDVAESCTGGAPDCPDDTFMPATTVCGDAPSDCQQALFCSGVAATCAASANLPDGTSCNNGGGHCMSGVCQALDHSRYGWKGCGCDGSAGLLPLLGLLVVARRRRLSVLVIACVCATAASAAEPKKLKLVFTGMAPGAGVSEDTAKSVAEYVQSELTRIDEYKVVSPGDLAAVLGVERQKQLLGCSDASGSCMAELAGALDADRLLRGDLSRIDETIVVNLSLIDLRKSDQVGRVGRRVESGGISAALREIQPLLYELLNQTPEHKNAPLVYEQGFASVTVGLRGEGDVFARGIAPAVFAELAGKYFGGALTVIATTTPGGRLEGRFYPKTFAIARPYLSLGGIVFTTGLGVHAGAGIAVRFSHIVLSFDAAYERFLVDFQPGYSPNSVVLALGAGWAF